MFLSIGNLTDKNSENELRLRGLKTFVQRLKEIGFGFKIVEDLMEDSLVDGKLFWILWPDRWFMPPEITTIVEKMGQGCGLLTTSEWSGIEYNAEILNSLISDMGMKFNKDRIIDPINAYTMDELKGKTGGSIVSGGKIVEFIKIKDFGEHPIVEGINELAYYSGCSLITPRENMLAKSKFVSFADIDGDKKWSEGEKIGSAIVAAQNEIGSGRVVAVGDTSLFTDKYVKFGDNDKFMQNVLKWLLKVI
jgi:hypothetical protein